MSDDSGLSPDEQERFNNLYGSQETSSAPSTPSWYSGAYKGLAGIPSGLAAAPLDIASAATDTPTLDRGYAASIGVNPDQYNQSLQDYAKTMPQGEIHQSVADLRDSAAELYRPDPQTTGFVGNTLFGALDTGTRIGIGNLLAPGAGLGIAAGTSGYDRTKDLEAQGVDPQTAQVSGALTGGSLLAMGGATSFGSGLLAKVLTGAATNATFGASTRALDSHILEAGGYHAQAEQQKWNDGASMLADTIIGAAFPLLEHRGAPKVGEQPAGESQPAPSPDGQQPATGDQTGQTADATVETPDGAKVETSNADGDPPVADGMTRLYHGSAEHGRFDGPAWFSSDRKYAANYRPDAQLQYVDVPTEWANSKVDPDGYGQTIARGHTLHIELDSSETGLRKPLINQAPAKIDPDSIPADLVDSALTVKNAQNITDLAPGVPADPQSAGAHVDALDTAQDQMLAGQPVNVEPIVRDSTFAPRPEAAEPDLAGAMRDSGISNDDLIDALPRKPDAQITSEFTDQLADHPTAVDAYSQIPETDGGKVLSTDIGREMNADYLMDRTRSAPVHEPASAFIKQLYADKLQEPIKPGENGDVMFTAGGTGAGKTSGIDGVPELKEMRDESSIVYDTNMNKFDSANAKIQQALDANRRVNIVYTYRDPVDALVHGALPRAERQREQFGSGRTVPLAEHLKTHDGSYHVIKELQAKYADDPRVTIDVLDNSHGKGKQRVSSMDAIPEPSPDMHSRLTEALHREYNEGRISEPTYRGFAEGKAENPDARPRERTPAPDEAAGGDRNLDGSAEVPEGRGSSAPEVSGRDESQGTGGQESRGPDPSLSDAGDAQTPAGDAADPAEPGQAQPRGTGKDPASGERASLDPARDAQVERARQVAASRSDETLIEPTEDGANSRAVTTADAMREADEAVTEAAKTSDGIKAAIACFLRFGADV